MVIIPSNPIHCQLPVHHPLGRTQQFLLCLEWMVHFSPWAWIYSELSQWQIVGQFQACWGWYKILHGILTTIRHLFWGENLQFWEKHRQGRAQSREEGTGKDGTRLCKISAKFESQVSHWMENDTVQLIVFMKILNAIPLLNNILFFFFFSYFQMQFLEMRFNHSL